ncbi:hypothetical protein SAMN05661008_00979 [Alkalithermobacter thermoalcaliphilus JW-YL-7 = DSM 7308]|uniref:GrdX, grdx protein n=1 Tax=Alkalithermobacter thermoalcaliphilus JW-YL-7 = DSM 7308 TaxID=1121328 RepID=A0A150FNV2_CLOPD|nr:grdX, grdx protein [[Clostridium] paradoxum JW-YL-7 = DSM 7308]SHK83987.1 hypothetical protein SAMN05661008_00979 [[Clostridium] paradoxum JW-YL-7 = DSM 7308]
MILLTNNPLVKDTFEGKIKVEFLDCNYISVLTKCRDYIHKGFKILTHPLSGSIKPNETPYKSILIENIGKLDIDSLLIIEKSIETTNKFNRNFKTPNWSEKILKDFQIVDLDLIKNAIEKNV